MADEGLRFEAWSMPHVGALTKKFDFSKWVESYVLNDRFSDLSDGTLAMPDDFPLRDELFKIDEANHANDAGSMVRVLRGTTPLLHYMVTRSEDRWSDTDPTHRVTLEGLEWLLDRAIVPHYDDPADPTVEPDWVYGAPNILGNPSFDTGPITNEVKLVWVTGATGGTFTLTFGGNITAAIAWNAGAADVANALEALASVDDVGVSGAGSASNPWRIEWIAPSGTDMGALTGSGASLTPGGAALAIDDELVKGGQRLLSDWTRSYHPSTGALHGAYNNFEISANFAHTGTYSLLLNTQAPASPGAFGGAQQIREVSGGLTYRAEVWVRPDNAGLFRLVLRTLDETFIAASSPYEGVSLTGGVWTKITVGPVRIPSYVTQVIFRVATVSTGAIGNWYVDDALLAVGSAPSKYGQIMSDVRTAAVAKGVLTWLTPTWTTTLDSDGVAWDQDLSWRVASGQTFLQLLEYARRWNYEWSIRWDVGDNRFEWDMWNPSGGGVVRTVAVTGKSGVTSAAPIVRRPPVSTYTRVDGNDGRWGDHTSTTLDDVWGRLEKAEGDRQGLDSTGLDTLALRLVTRGGEKTAGRAVQVEDPSILPWTAYLPGDTVTLNLAPTDTKRALRVAAVVASMSPGQAAPTYEVHFVAPVYSNEAALAQGLRTVMREVAASRTAAIPTPGPGSISAAGFNMSAFTFEGDVFVHSGRHRLTFPAKATLVSVILSVNTAPTGAAIICDIHKSGVTVFTDQTTRPQIAIGTFASAESSPQVTSIGIGEYLTVDTDQRGSTLAGADLVASVRWTEST